MENELPAIIALVTKLVDDAGILADALACHASKPPAALTTLRFTGWPL